MKESLNQRSYSDGTYGGVFKRHEKSSLKFATSHVRDTTIILWSDVNRNEEVLEEDLVEGGKTITRATAEWLKDYLLFGKAQS